MEQHRVRDVIVAALVAGGILSAGIAIGTGGWPGAPSGCIAAGDCSCEALGSGLLRQPATAISALVFVLAGLGILRSRPGRLDNRFAQRTYARLYGSVVISLGFGSFFFHAAVTEWAGWLDLVALHLFVTFLLLYDLAALLRRTTRWFLVSFVTLNGVLAAVFWPLDNGYGKYSIGILLAATLILEYLLARPGTPVARDRRWLGAALGVYGAGQVAWLLSREGSAWCRPDSLLQGHALWHLLAAVTVTLLFFYFRSERERPSPY
jgi:hypothetical protein